MPLGKYYCDYCQKQFQDTPSARKRHLEGAQHQRAKALWYASVRSAGSLEGVGAGAVGGTLPARPVCHYFLRMGFCQFGDGCRFLHPNQNAMNEPQMMPGPTAGVPVHGPSSMGTQFIGSSVLGNMVNHHAGISWGNLPPSLRPPPEGGYPPLPFIDWG